MPASAVASLTPAMGGMSGTSVGASGETEEDMKGPVDKGMPGTRPGMTSTYRNPLAKSNYFFAGGAILESLAASTGAVEGAGALAAWSIRSTLAVSRSLPT